MRSILSNHAALAERSQQVVRTIEVRHLHEGRADTLRIVRVGAHARSDIELLGECDRGEIVRGLRDFCVEHLDNVQLPRCHQRLQDRLPQSGALGVKRVRRVHQPALCFDAVDHLGHRQDVRNALGQEQTDNFSRRRANLFADDDTNAELTTEGFRRLDRVMIGDAHHVEADRFHALGKLLQRGARVARYQRVQMTVEPNPPGASSRWWPNWIKIQQQ